MRRGSVLLILAIAAIAAPTASRAGSPSRAPARSATAARHVAPRHASITAPRRAETTASARPSSPDSTSHAAASRSDSRTLDEIRIEGEIAVPQVLFITARDQRRFLDFQHRRYETTCLELGEATPLPTSITLTTAPGTEARKEIVR